MKKRTPKTEAEIRGMKRQQNTVKILRVLDQELLPLLVERQRLLKPK